MTRRIAIVGGGLSGTLTAVHLMRRAAADDLNIVLVNRSGGLARGVAYGTRSAAHVLNVPAGRMSAFEGDDTHFLRYAQRRDPPCHGGSFVAREVYGDYLEWLLRSAQAALAEPQRFVHLVGQVDDLDAGDTGAALHIGDAAPLRVDRIVLALGNGVPADPPLADTRFFDRSARYLRDPWRRGALDAVDLAQPVLLLGSGLTMVDEALALQARGQRGVLHALSRRGLLPQAHRESHTPPASVALPAGLLDRPAVLRHWLRLVREQCRALAAHGTDWRDTLAALRAATPQLWERLALPQRAQFLRHLQAHWDVHRHRLAPSPAAGLAALRGAGALQLHAGRLLQIDEQGDAVMVGYRPRGQAHSVALQVGSVVNCTGPDTRLARSSEPLLRGLAARGLVVPDALGLGLEVAGDYGVVQADGRASSVLHYIGPFLRARYWECTAVPELRQHAQRLAERLCA